MQKTTFDLIDQLSTDNLEIRRSLIFGFLRGISIKKQVQLLDQFALDDNYGSTIFRCLLDTDDKKTFNILGEKFLDRIKSATKYPEIRKIGSYLNRLYDKCGLKTQTNIARYCLSSGKRYLRKYAYAKNLSKLNSNIFYDAWDKIIEFPTEATFLLKTVAYHYDQSFIDERFNLLISHPEIEDYQIRKLYTRVSKLKKKDWTWLKIKSPSSLVYVATIRGHSLTDNECQEIYRATLEKLRSETDEFRFRGYDGLLLWCFARMGKWDVIENILS